jgi:prophage antirepressor-like protein
MNELSLLVEKFHDEDVLVFHGEQPWFIAKQVGSVLGYGNDGLELCKMINRHWTEEFEDGLDHVVVKGEHLKRLKVLADEGVNLPPSSSMKVSPKANQLMLLSEQGLYLACMKSGKPIGVQLRKWLKGVVLPAIRSQQFDALVAAQRKQLPTPAELDVEIRRSQKLRKNRRLRLQQRQQAEKERQAEHKRQIDIYKVEREMLEKLVDDRFIDQRGLRTAYCALLQKLTGDRVVSLLKPDGKYLSPTEMANAEGSTRKEIGMLIKELNIKRHPDLTRPVIRKAMHGVSKMVDTYEYNEEAQEMIYELLEEKREEQAKAS